MSLFFAPLPKSHKEGKKSDKGSKSKDNKSSGGSSSGGGSSNSSSSKKKEKAKGPVLSFLFVINELCYYDEDRGFIPNFDVFGNPLPQNFSVSYYAEIKGKVWRYENGTVTQAPEYFWQRPRFGSAGAITVRYSSFDEYNRPITMEDEMEIYSTHSVFNCWRFLPCIWTDADVSTVEEMNLDHRWNPLEFRHDVHHPGVTHVYGGSERYVAGKNPSWIPSLLPMSFSNPEGDAPSSKGLSGPLGIILGLMALSKESGYHDDVFKNGQWKNNCWSGQRSPRAEPFSKGPPRGVMVQICIDSYHNPEGSTMAAIRAFERSGKVIIG